MKKIKIIYWSATGFIGLLMLFSAYKMYTPDYKHLGFPNYFRTELVIAKILGVMALLIPQIPARVKEWAYAGIGIVIISASVAHFCSGDAILNGLEPLVFLIILAVSNVYFHKLSNVQSSPYKL